MAGELQDTNTEKVVPLTDFVPEEGVDKTRTAEEKAEALKQLEGENINKKEETKLLKEAENN